MSHHIAKISAWGFYVRAIRERFTFHSGKKNRLKINPSCYDSVKNIGYWSQGAYEANKRKRWDGGAFLNCTRRNWTKKGR